MRTSLTALATLGLLLFASCSQAGRQPASRFEGGFGARLRSADPVRRFVALVDLTEQIDPRAIAKQLIDAKGGKAEKRRRVIDAYESLAAKQQARLRPLLDRLIASGSITAVHPVAIVNRVIVEGTADGLRALAGSEEVAIVRPDWTSERGASAADVLPSNPAAPLPAAFTSWAIGAMNVERMWAMGYDGSGVVVAAIDTGAYELHEQLCCRRAPGERGWFDPVEGSTTPHDAHGHGTGVLSQAVGGNPEGRILGVAPRAQWAAALGNWKNFYVRSRMTLAADWIFRVARPDVVVNAWSHDEGECTDFDRPFVTAWKAAQTFVVFPAGNGGPKPSSGESPAQLLSVFSVTALAENGRPNARASRGPSRCGSSSFPSVAAPGLDLPMAALGNPRAYLRGEGTSLSAGLVGGAAALLLQAEPETDPETLERALTAGARDVEPPGRDDLTGAGAIDLAAALSLLRASKKP
jgi:bacillopeptidase F